jgi:hypothetical protein
MRIRRITEKQARTMPAGFYLYLAETLTKLGMNFDGTKFGICKAEAGLWGRLRSHSTNCPFGSIVVLEFDTAAQMAAAETTCKAVLPTLAWNGGEREYTDLTPETALELILEAL